MQKESGRLAETSRNIDEQENSLEQMRMQQKRSPGRGNASMPIGKSYGVNLQLNSQPGCNA